MVTSTDKMRPGMMAVVRLVHVLMLAGDSILVVVCKLSIYNMFIKDLWKINTILGCLL